MKNLSKIIAMTAMILLLCLMVACGAGNKEQQTVGAGQLSLKKTGLMDVSVVLIDTPYEEYVQLRENATDEAVFIINNIPDDKIMESGDFRYILSTNEKYAAIIEYTGNEKKVKFTSIIDKIPVVCVTGWGEKLSDTASAGYSVSPHFAKEIKKIELPDTIVAIGPNAFNYFDGLEEVSLSESLTHIYAGAFSFCKALKEMEFPVSMVMIDDRAFYDCESLSRINLHEGLECIGEECFGNCANLEEVTLPTSVLYVCEGAFGGCEQLKTVTLTENTVMHKDVFQESPFESDRTIPDLVYYDVERSTESKENQGVDAEIDEAEYIEDFAGYTLRIFDVGSVDDRYYSMFEQESIEEAIEKVEELYNCRIVEVTSEDYLAELTGSRDSGESFCDIAIIPGDKVVSCMESASIIPWQQSSTVNLADSWWDQAANERYKFGNVQVAISGDFNYNNYAAMMCYAFNFEKLDAVPYDDMYDDMIRTFSHELLMQNEDFGKNGSFQVGNELSNFMYNGGICGSKLDYYRTMLAGNGCGVYNISDAGEISLSFERGYDFLGYMDGVKLDSAARQFRNNMCSDTLWVEIIDDEIVYLDPEDIFPDELQEEIREDSMAYSGNMEELTACDDSLFFNGTSTFKIVRLDEILELRQMEMQIGLVNLPGGVYSTLIDTPTFAVQLAGTQDEYKNFVLLNAIAEYSSEKMVSAFKDEIIGQNENAEYNRQMLDDICACPYYEFDIGALGDEIEYFYYKYMLGYVSDEIWSKRAVSSDIFDVVQLERLPEVGQVLSGYLDTNFDVGAKSSVAETPVPEEAWAEAYYEAVSQYPYSGILDYALDISKISALCSDNGGKYISDAIVLNAVMSAYVVISGDEPETYEEYRSFEEFYLNSDLSRSDNTIIERLFYEPDAELVRFPLSFVQKALDFLYGVGTFDARRLSDEVGCYLPEDSQYVYMQILSDMSESKVYCRLAEVRYQDNEAILFMNVVGSRYEEGYTVLYDYTNQTALVKEEGSVSYGGSGPIGRVENEGIDLDELGIVKLRLFRDSDGIHIKNFSIVEAE